jgi:tetratricopeptide (TPR) repeat protein
MNYRAILPCAIVAAALTIPAPVKAAPVTELLAQGDALDAQLKTKEALAIFLEAEKQAPANAEVLRRIAKAEAELMTETGVKTQRKDLGVKSVDYARRAVAADPNNAMTHLTLAVCCGRVAPYLDNQDKINYSKIVKEHAGKALALDPSNDYGYHVLGAWNYELAGLNPILRAIARIVYGSVPEASYDDAVANFKKAIALAPQRVAHHIELGRTYAAMGQAKLAKAELTEGLALPCREKDDPETKERGRLALQKL